MDVERAPFPWFGGKSRAAALIWARLGMVSNYIEPFAGSLAVLLNRPHAPRIETINDLDAYLSNFWRAIQADPEQVALYADWPVSEADLHARHRWLLRELPAHREKMMTDPDYFDAKIAGWWVWGLCQWIGGGVVLRGNLLGPRAGAREAPAGSVRKHARAGRAPKAARCGRGPCRTWSSPAHAHETASLRAERQRVRHRRAPSKNHAEARRWAAAWPPKPWRRVAPAARRIIDHRQDRRLGELVSAAPAAAAQRSRMLRVLDSGARPGGHLRQRGHWHRA